MEHCHHCGALVERFDVDSEGDTLCPECGWSQSIRRKSSPDSAPKAKSSQRMVPIKMSDFSEDQLKKIAESITPEEKEFVQLIESGYKKMANDVAEKLTSLGIVQKHTQSHIGLSQGNTPVEVKTGPFAVVFGRRND